MGFSSQMHTLPEQFIEHQSEVLKDKNILSNSVNGSRSSWSRSYRLFKFYYFSSTLGERNADVWCWSMNWCGSVIDNLLTTELHWTPLCALLPLLRNAPLKKHKSELSFQDTLAEKSSAACPRKGWFLELNETNLTDFFLTFLSCLLKQSLSDFSFLKLVSSGICHSGQGPVPAGGPRCNLRDETPPGRTSPPL